MDEILQAPFPWFGGKSRVADLVWSRFGDVPNYAEPFFGSGAVLLGRPGQPGIETVNDIDGFVSNFWRAVKHSPDETAQWADNPVNENDLHARHAWLVQHRESLRQRLEGDPDFHDPKIAGWWVWGLCCWIGNGWCSENGPWVSENGALVNGGSGGITRKLPHLGDRGMGVNRSSRPIYDWFARLSARLARVRVCSGDWSRVCGPSPTFRLGITGVFLDPPYADTAGRDPDIYSHDCLRVAHDVREWAIENGKNPLMRIALCGYEGEHQMPDDWEKVEWKAKGGYAGQGDGPNVNATKERIWFSPACERAVQYQLL
jgi:DNA adenine methylase